VSKIRLPGPDKRTVIVGSTGSGKTQAGFWHLANKDFHKRPWFVIDFKGELLFLDAGLEEIDVRAKPPMHPGVYVLRPKPMLDDDALTAFLWRLWKQEYCGLYTDEGYMLPGVRNPAFRALLTQGRSKRIEMITLSQRPVWMDKFTFTEADFWQIFRLNGLDDRKSVSAIIGNQIDRDLPEFNSYWYDVGRNSTVRFAPVPGRDDLLEIFRERLVRRKLKVL
jgi:hypothetical protein